MNQSDNLPRLPVTLLRLLLPRASRREVLADVAQEYHARCARDGRDVAGRWLWRQALESVSPLIRWRGWREVQGFEPQANAYRPGGPVLKYLFADIRFAARRLRMRLGYTTLAVLTLSLGIGGTAAVFGIARPILVDRLPYANADEVTSFWFGGSWTEEEFMYLRDRFPGYRAVAAHRPADFTAQQPDAPARLLTGRWVTSELFDVLGAPPLLGRALREGDDAPGAEPVAILSYGLWQELGGSPDVIGTRLTIDGTPRTIVGVMPQKFWFPNPAVRIWIPRELNPEARNGSYNFIGHVAQGEDPAKMEAHTARLVAIMDERFDYDADWDKTRNAWVKPLREELLGTMRPAIVATLVAIGLILLIACTNVAALMLGQVERRGTELAVRSALGASRSRLTQPLLIEAILIGVLAAIVGAAFAAGGFNFLANALPIGSWAAGSRLDLSVFAAALVVALAASSLVVFVPSVALLRSDARGGLQTALSRGRTGGIGGGRNRLERALVVVEVSLAMLIASGAMLLARSVNNLYAIDAGIDKDGVAIVDAVASSAMPSVERRAKVNDLLRESANLPGVAAVGATMKAPLRGPGDSFGFNLMGRPDNERQNTYFRVVTPGYLETMRLRLTRGRWFDQNDRLDSAELVVVVNEALAEKYFPGEDPIGKRVVGGFSLPQRIVGVVANVAEAGLTDDRTPVRYFAHEQVPWFGTTVTLLLRTQNPDNATSVLDGARKTVERAAPELAVQGTTTMSRVFDAAVGPARQLMTLLTLLTALALLLGAIGIYGVISHFAQRRMRDYAIRVALGLTANKVMSHIVGQGAALVLTGVVLGVLGTLAVSRLLASFLYGVQAIDPVSILAAGTALVLVGVVAAFIPARRAGRVDPAIVLREDA